MRITIDNLDGLGPCDYTAQVCSDGPITITRRLNEPTLCTAIIIAAGGGLALPVRKARVVVTAEDAASTVLFTGYLTREPACVFAGVNTEGSVYRAELAAISDEWLLDRSASGAGPVGSPVLALDGRQLLNRITTCALAGSTALTTSTTGAAARSAGPFLADASAAWSGNASAAAGATYAGYRALNGSVALVPAAATTHVFADDDGVFSPDTFNVRNIRELSNDVTLSGEEEPAAYVSECFHGDGTTAAFTLSHRAFVPKEKTLVADTFAGPTFDTTQWVVSDPASRLSITGAGLTFNGGNGLDGNTMLTAIDAIELGGTLVAELSGVKLNPGCVGVLGGFYQQPQVLANCVAGFRVRQQLGVGNVIVAFANGAEAGTVFQPQAGHVYTLRMRVHSVEPHRLRQLYYAMVNGTVESFGSLTGIAAPLDLVFEIVDEGAASNTPATVLYDTATTAPLMTAPATCAFVAVNSLLLSGSVNAVRLTHPGGLWAVSTLPGGTQQTRLIGAAGEGVDCTAQSSGAGGVEKLTFLAGRVPVANERLTVSYRAVARSVARLQDPVSVAAEAAGGGIGTCRWLGSIAAPETRSSEDCENAAAAILAIAGSRSETLAGTFSTLNPVADIWPGDLLQVTTNGATNALLVREIVVRDGGCAEEVRHYRIGFSNDWATEFAAGLGLKLSDRIAADAVLPLTAATAPGGPLANLQQLSVTALSTTAVQIDAGTAPPAGGGFEVRHRDDDFGPQTDADLVLRSTVRSFSLPRGAQVETFYIRQYDASTPRIYSRFSSAVVLNWPTS